MSYELVLVNDLIDDENVLCMSNNDTALHDFMTRHRPQFIYSENKYVSPNYKELWLKYKSLGIVSLNVDELRELSYYIVRNSNIVII